MKGSRSMKGGEAVREFNGVRVVRAGGGRKDRHSKVCTARGTRDRRVRLSPNTAILFYDVQDRLGYDRPSKAIDWLMKEAKSAIDALDNPNPPTAANFNHSAAAESNLMLRFERELVKEHSINEFNPGLFNEGAAAAPPLSSLSCRREDYDEQFMYAPTPPIELFDENSEIIRMQRIFYAANAGGEDYSSAAPANFFSEREPLLSSTYSRINNNSPHFQGFSFSDEELPDFCGIAKFKEDGIGNSKSSSSASFLHFED